MTSGILSFFLMVSGVISTDYFYAIIWVASLGFTLGLVFQFTVFCPRCGKSPYAWGKVRSVYLGGKPIPDRICSNCGYDLVHGGDPNPIKAPATASEVSEKADGSKPL
ncbi:hypothetical protein JDN40_16980 [Rhodomicrobium vannielii ATCC 17100]|uniref:hypothetical protein n=1 Tax=Rhodomicrobium vannielii TaxID=1069 RepID=UPI0019194D56|nr:hypothetical protein [Rhodomicrobium vannielii]MBJ7535803.1 hypothetical protein [Rhodomicrobium vannielii ATCC 17100]